MPLFRPKASQINNNNSWHRYTNLYQGSDFLRTEHAGRGGIHWVSAQEACFERVQGSIGCDQDLLSNKINNLLGKMIIFLPN